MRNSEQNKLKIYIERERKRKRRRQRQWPEQRSDRERVSNAECNNNSIIIIMHRVITNLRAKQVWPYLQRALCVCVCVIMFGWICGVRFFCYCCFALSDGCWQLCYQFDQSILMSVFVCLSIIPSRSLSPNFSLSFKINTLFTIGHSTPSHAIVFNR